MDGAVFAGDLIARENAGRAARLCSPSQSRPERPDRRTSGQFLYATPFIGSNKPMRPRPARQRRDLNSLDQDVGSVGRQRLQVVRIGREYGPSGFRECHDKRIDSRPTTGQPPQ